MPDIHTRSYGPQGQYVFVLKLTGGGTVIRVCLQVKHTKAISKQELEKAIRTTDPSSFLSQVGDNDLPVCSNPSMQDEMEEAIKSLGKGTQKARPCGVLQLVVSYPAPLDSGVLEDASRVGHPLVTLPVHLQEPEQSVLGQAVLSLANCAKRTLLNPDQKRKASERDEGARPKRQRM